MGFSMVENAEKKVKALCPQCREAILSAIQASLNNNNSNNNSNNNNNDKKRKKKKKKKSSSSSSSSSSSKCSSCGIILPGSSLSGQAGTVIQTYSLPVICKVWSQLVLFGPLDTRQCVVCTVTNIGSRSRVQLVPAISRKAVL